MSVTAATGEHEYKVPEFRTGKGVWKGFLFFTNKESVVCPAFGTRVLLE